MSPKGNTPTRMGEARELTTDEKVLAERLGEQFELLDKLGSGGMGTVYKAWNRKLEIPVAVKVVRDTAGDDAHAIKRLRNEAQALGALQHANIVRVMHLQQLDNNQLALVMEYVDGKDLQALISAAGKLQPAQCRNLLKQCAEALSAAHERGIIHRDLKPSNIVVTISGGEERVKILDFGLAKLSESGSQKLTRTGNVIGSPAYMSPEQVRAESLDIRSDIYSLGCVFFEALTGAPPFAGESIFEVILKHANERVPIVDISDKQLSDIIAKCTEPDAAQRFQSPSELLDALAQESFRHEASTKQMPAVQAPATHRFNKVLIIPAILCLIVGAIAAGVFVGRNQVQRQEQPDPYQRATLMRRYIYALHDWAKEENRSRPVPPELFRNLLANEDVITNSQDAVDLAHAYKDLGRPDDSFRISKIAIALQEKEGIPRDKELAKVAAYYLDHGAKHAAQQVLQDEIVYEKARNKRQPLPGTVAKAYMDMALFGFLINDDSMQAAAIMSMNQNIGSEEDREYLFNRASEGEDALFDKAFKINRSFALGLIKASPSVRRLEGP